MLLLLSMSFWPMTNIKNWWTIKKWKRIRILIFFSSFFFSHCCRRRRHMMIDDVVGIKHNRKKGTFDRTKESPRDSGYWYHSISLWILFIMKKCTTRHQTHTHTHTHFVNNAAPCTHTIQREKIGIPKIMKPKKKQQNWYEPKEIFIILWI